MELFDRVNERDEVIGVTDKATAHREGHIHRLVAVYVFDQSGRLCVQMHKKYGVLDSSVGGHVGLSESYDAAAARESDEELGLTEPLKLIRVFDSDEGYWSGEVGHRHMTAFYECHASPQWHFVPNEEVEVIEPMTVAEAVERINREPARFAGGFMNSMAVYLETKRLPYELKLPELRSL